MCPLDLTNNVPVTSELVHKIGKQRDYPISDLAG
jgi:purine nucleosidase